jgi:hypothetical protein
MKGLRGPQAALLILLLFSAISAAADQTSQTENPPQSISYTLTSSVMSAAGVSGASTNFQTDGSLGQPTPIGTGTGGGKIVYAGFWAAFQRLSWLTDTPLPDPLVDKLYQNYPNPFNPATTIRFSVARESHVKIVIYNLRGEYVRELVNEAKPTGRYTVLWDGKDSTGRMVASGAYTYTLQVGNFSSVKKMLLLK